MGALGLGAAPEAPLRCYQQGRQTTGPCQGSRTVQDAYREGEKDRRYAVSIRVLLVDEHENARTRLVQRLRRDAQLEFVVGAASLEDVERLLPEAQPDIVLLDIHSHDGRGLEVCRELSRMTGAPVVVLASFMTPDLWAAAQEVGATDYLLKHIDTHRLGRDIVRLVERYRSESDLAADRSDSYPAIG